MRQYPLDKTFIVAAWLEALVYGFFFCLFCASVYVHVSVNHGHHNAHSRAMFYIGVAMFVLSTIHLAMNCYRLIQGYVTHVNEPGGAVAYIGDLRRWDHIFKDTLYATQEIFGDGVAIYRTWVIWNRNWKVIVLPVMLFILSIISGYAVCALFSTVDPAATVFNPVLTQWIKTFYSVAVVQSTLTTGLMAYRIWATDRRTAIFRTARSHLMPIFRILLESASLLLFVEVLLLSLYLANYNAQYILLEIITPTVGITFTAITLRISLRLTDMTRETSGQGSSRPLPNSMATELSTNNTIPMRGITINIAKDVQRVTSDALGGKADYDPEFIGFESRGQFK